MSIQAFSFIVLFFVAFPSLAGNTNTPGRPRPGAIPTIHPRTETYKTVDDIKLAIHIYEPDGHKTNANAPAIVFFFGGGWISGTPQQFAPHCEYFASRGMVAMTADYRVFSRHGTPATKCVEDAKSAIRWLRANASRLGVDPTRVAAGGGSAGGHIAACTGLIQGYEADNEDQSVSSIPNALVLFNPALVLADFDGIKQVRPARLENLEKRVGTAPRNLSPIHHIKKGAPPMIVFHGKVDTTVPYDSVEAFADATKKAGNRCELFGYEGQGHAFFNFGKGNNAYFTATVKEADKFLNSLGWLTGPPTIERFFKAKAD